MPETPGLAAVGEYIESHSTSGHEIIEGLEYMKRHDRMPPKKLDVLKSKASPRPNYAALPGSLNSVMTGTTAIQYATGYPTSSGSGYLQGGNFASTSYAAGPSTTSFNMATSSTDYTPNSSENPPLDEAWSASATTGKGDGIGTWCEWYWSTEYNCEARHRENRATEGGWDYEYRQPAKPPRGKGKAKP